MCISTVPFSVCRARRSIDNSTPWTEAGKSAVVGHLEGIEVPRFPVTGNDLIEKGFSPGPGLGAELDRLEKKWIASKFRLDKAALLADLKR